MALYCNANKGKDTKAFAPTDFMPYEDKPKKIATNEMEEYLMSMVGR